MNEWIWIHQKLQFWWIQIHHSDSHHRALLNRKASTLPATFRCGEAPPKGQAMGPTSAPHRSNDLLVKVSTNTPRISSFLQQSHQFCEETVLFYLEFRFRFIAPWMIYRQTKYQRFVREFSCCNTPLFPSWRHFFRSSPFTPTYTHILL